MHLVWTAQRDPARCGFQCRDAATIGRIPQGATGYRCQVRWGSCPSPAALPATLSHLQSGGYPRDCSFDLAGLSVVIRSPISGDRSGQGLHRLLSYAPPPVHPPRAWLGKRRYAHGRRGAGAVDVFIL